jgi:hypothetical protein
LNFGFLDYFCRERQPGDGEASVNGDLDDEDDDDDGIDNLDDDCIDSEGSDDGKSILL